MKLAHLSDLHLGKRVNGFSMLEDQRHILARIIELLEEEQPDGVLLAGDIYDKPVPPAEAVELFDDFLVALSRKGWSVFVISGNHDSPERIAFGGRLMAGDGVHVSPVYNGTVTPITLADERGPVDIWLLPFLKPAHVRRCWPEEEIGSYTDALREVIGHMDIDSARRNVLVTHQFVTGAERCESEELSVGGSDNVDVSVFEPFDYVALGHIHGPQSAGRTAVRYCGTPLKYSFSETRHVKSLTMVDLTETVSVRTVPLTPLRDMRELRGTYEELTHKAFYDGTTYPADYLHITLTDEEDVPDAIGKLRVIYPYLMKLDYDNRRTRAAGEITAAEDVEEKSPMELFADLFELQNDVPMSAEQEGFLSGLLEKIWEGDV